MTHQGILYQKDWINEEWNTDLYQELKRENFELLDRYLDSPPRTILDIGCGMAFESRLFNQHHGSELWLLDGDYDQNHFDLPLVQARYVEDTRYFAFYHTLDTLKGLLDQAGAKDYHLVDANNIDLSVDLKFDLITSWMSCGFHYPISTYRDLIRKHSHDNTVVIMDLRIKPDLVKDHGVTIHHVLNSRSKYQTCHIGIS